MLDRESLTISLDVAELQAGTQRRTIDDSDINKPRELSVHRVEPEAVTIVAHPTVDVELPVKAAIGGGLPARLKLVGVTVSPDRVTVALRRSERAGVSRILTEPIDLSRIDSTTTLSRAIKVPNGARLPPGAPSDVRVRVEVAAR
jgi:YbbR domain-containing protein